MPAHAAMTSAPITIPASAPVLKDEEDVPVFWLWGGDEIEELCELFPEWVEVGEFVEVIGVDEAEIELAEADAKSFCTGGA